MTSGQKGFIVLFFLATLIVFGLYKVMDLQQERKVSQTPVTVTCPLSGELDKYSYLPTYTVRSGDTLLKISKEKLSDPARVQEIVTLNQDRYGGLSLQHPFLEKGWVLVLPPTEVSSTNGHLRVIAGSLSLSIQGWGVDWPNAAVGPFPLTDLPSSLSDKECVIVIYQTNDPVNMAGMKVYSVTKQ